MPGMPAVTSLGRPTGPGSDSSRTGSSSGRPGSSDSTTARSSGARHRVRPGPWSASTPEASPANLPSLEVEDAAALLGGEAVDDPQHAANGLVRRNGRAGTPHSRLYPAGMESHGPEPFPTKVLGQQLRHHVHGCLARPV